MVYLVDVLDEDGCGVYPEAVIALVGAVLDAEAADGALTVVFVEEPVIADLNLRYRGLGEPTDVLSFPEEGADGNWPEDDPTEVLGSDGEDFVRELGELVVCPDVVRGHAVEEGNEVNWQLAWTIVHGVLHLLGYDHETDTGEMRARERTLLAGAADPVPLLLWADGT